MSENIINFIRDEIPIGTITLHPRKGYCLKLKKDINTLQCWECSRDQKFDSITTSKCKNLHFRPYVIRDLKNKYEGKK